MNKFYTVDKNYMGQPTFILRPMQETDIKGAMKLSTDAGWNQTEKDWKFLTVNPENICLTAEHNQKIIATTTAINYSNQVSWIGMVLVDKEYRGHRLSKILLTTILEKLNVFISVKLDATPEGQPVYKKFDFKDEYLIARMVNTSVKRVIFNEDDLLPEPFQPQHLQEIIALDEYIFGANRSILIQFLLSEYPGKSWLINRNNRITGFVSGRDGVNYHQVGPVIASATIDAKILLTKALNHLTDQPVVVDVPYDKIELISWLNTIGFTKQRHFTRMYKKENPLPGIPGEQYLICGPEFG
ncbi:MAG: GNAT family N-acetyltransferase [Chitinophagaceae bacterium]